jgi:hypothetical protein
MELMKLEELKEKLAKGEVFVTFDKKDGTRRSMKCTRSGAMIPEEHAPKGIITEKEGDTNVRVFDLEKQGWRSFNYDSVIDIQVEG